EHFIANRLSDRVRFLVSRIGGRQFSQHREGTRQVYVGGTVSLNSREDWIGRGANQNVRRSCVGHFNLRWLLTPGGGIKSKYRSNEITLALIRRPLARLFHTSIEAAIGSSRSNDTNRETLTHRTTQIPVVCGLKGK